jgi:hypothetical protein
MPDKVSPSQFAAKIKEKYPEYSSIDDSTLVDAILKKYPDYRSAIDFGPEKPILSQGPKRQEGLPTFQQQQQTLQQAQAAKQEPVLKPIETKYDKAVQDDRSKSGKLLSTVYNGLIEAGESLAGFFAELGGSYSAIPTAQSFIAETVAPQPQKPMKIEDLAAEQKKAREEAKGFVKKSFGTIKSDYVSKEESQKMQGKFDVTNGIGLDDMEGIVAMSGRIVGDIALAVPTFGSSYFMQAYSDGVDEFDETAAKMGIEANPNARAFYGMTVGTINGLLEKYAIDKIVGSGPIFKNLQKKIVANVLKDTAPMAGKAAIEAIEESAKKEIKRVTSTLKANGLRAGYRMLVESGTEGAQSAAEDGAKFAANWAQGVDVFNEQEIKNEFGKKLINSAAAGGIYGPVIGLGMDKTFGRNINTQVLDDIANAKTQEDLDKINQDLQETFDKNKFSDAERQMVMDNARRYAEVKQTLPADTPADAQKIAIPKIEDRIKIDREIEAKKAELETVDESVKPTIQQDIDMLQDRRSQLNDQIREAITGDKFQYVEENGKFYKQTPDGTREQISKTRYDLEQLKQEEDATKEGQGPIQEGRTTGDIGQRQGVEGEQAQTTTKTDTRYRNISSEKAVGIPSFLGMTVTYKLPNRKITGTLIQEGQTISVEDENGDIVAELGNIDELSNMSPEEMNLTVIEPNVELTENGFSVDGKELFNENENPFDAVSVDQNGNVMNVVLTTAGGKRRKFRGRVAQKLADQIGVKEDQRLAAEDQKLQQEFALPTPTAPKVITTQPTIAKITEDNLDQIDSIPGSTLQKKVLGNVKTVVKAIGAAVKNITGYPVSVNIHDQKSFTDAVIEAGGTQEDSVSRGFYMGSDGSIHLNMDALDSDTMLHEGFHPILDILEKYNPEIINDLFTELESIPEAADIIAQAKEDYTGDVTQKKEAITDFVAGVADGRIVLNPSNFQKIKNFILNMLNKIGIGQGGSQLMNVNNEQDLIKLAKFITEKFATGETITFDQLEQIVGDDTADPVTVSNIAVVNPAQFALIPKKEKVFQPLNVKWVSKGLNLLVPKVKFSLFDIVSKSGGAVVVINSDATGIGMKKGVLRQGGIGYTFIQQNVEDNIGFAASMDSKQTAFFKAVQEAASIRDEKFPDMSGKPVAIFVMVQAPEVMFGNAYGADYFIKALSNALSHNEISTEEAKANIIDYFNSIKESNDTGRKYANSIDALIELINNSNLKSPKDRKKIYDLLITNRENKDDKSAKFGFDARRVLFGQFFNKVAAAKNKPGGKIRDILDKDGFNHKNFYDIYGDENVIKNLDGRTEGIRLGDGGFAMTGFYVDPTMTEEEFVEKSKSGKYVHKQFNGRFFGSDPFVLDGKYYVNEIFPEARFADENGNPIPVTTSAAGSMYPRTKTSPEAIVERARAISEPKFQKIPSADVIDGFYSPIVDRLNTFKQPKASVQKWKEIVGMKSDEAVFSGMSDWLNSKKPDQQLSKDEVLKFMKDNRIEVKEVVKGGEQKGGIEKNDVLRQFDEYGWYESDDIQITQVEEDDTYAVDYNGDVRDDFKSIDDAIAYANTISRPVAYDTRYENYQLPGGKNYKEVLITLPQKNLNKPKDNIYNELIQKRDELENQYNEENEKTFSRDTNESDSAFKNMYRILDELRKVNGEIDKYEQILEPVKFKSSHFNEPNIITHLRMNTRTDADGKKVLFLEEVQSDWGQKGKREGFKKDYSEDMARINKEIESIDKEIDSVLQEMYSAGLPESPSSYELEKFKNGRFQTKELINLDRALDKVKNNRDYEAITKEIESIERNQRSLSAKRDSLLDKKNMLKSDLENMSRSERYDIGVAKAPYITNTNAWVKLGLKVALKEAVKQGADRIAWTTGEQQNERYDLSKQADEIQYTDNGDGTYSYSAIKGNSELASKENVDINTIEAELGKDIADKILNSEGPRVSLSDRFVPMDASKDRMNVAKSLKGQDLKVGGKGMKAFYGDANNTGIVGNVAKALVKELTGKEGSTVESVINTGGKLPNEMTVAEIQAAGGVDAVKASNANSIQPAIDITPEVKQSVQQGMPQFKKVPKTVTKKPSGVEVFVKEQFRFGLLGKEIVKFKDKMSGELSAEVKTAENLVKDAQKVIEKYASSVTRTDVSNFMTGKPTSTPLPTDLSEALTAMRAHVDRLTERLIQLGVIEDQETIDYYRSNKGEYLVRSYEAINYKDGFWDKLGKGGLNIDNVTKKLVNVDKTVVDAALEFLANRAKSGNPALTDAQAMDIAKKEANDILSDAETYVFGKNLTGSVNVSSLSQRKDISPEIRALMGEYTDPLYNYYASIFKLANLTSSRQYLNSLKEFGMGKFLFTKDNRPDDANTLAAPEGSEALSPLNGLYTFKPVADALVDAKKETSNLIWQSMGRIRKFKTVYNPATHVKNVIGNMGFVVSNGHWNYLPETYKYMRALITGKDNQEVRRMMDTLNRYGVLNNSIGVNELKTYFDRHDDIDAFLSSIYDNGRKKSIVSKVANQAGKVGKAMEKAYAIEDDLFKVLAFVNESNRYAKATYNKKYADLSQDEKNVIDDEVAEIVKDTYPTFSRVPKFVKNLSKVAFVGNFLSFPAESIRVQYNSLKLALKEYNSGNPRLKKIGVTRMLGFIIYNSISSSLVYYSYNLAGAGLTGLLGYFGNDDEEEKKKKSSIQKNLAPWNKDKDVYISQFKDGKLIYYDMGSLDSYGYQKMVWNEFWNNMNDEKGFYKSAAKAVAKGLDPWMEIDFVVKNMNSLLTNDNGRGGKIWNPEDTPEGIAKKKAMFVGKQFSPGAVGAMIRIADAYQTGESDKVKDELISQVFARKYTVDLKKQFTNYMYVDGTPQMEVGFKNRLENAKKIYLDAKRQRLKGVELQERYQDAVNSYKSILMTASEYYNAAADGGVNPSQMNTIIKRSRIGRPATRSIINGYFPDENSYYIRK